MDYKALKTILKSIPMKPETVGPDELANQLCELAKRSDNIAKTHLYIVLLEFGSH